MSEPSRHDSQEPRFTYGDYRHWPPDQRWELIDGRAFAMTGPLRRHQEILTALLHQIYTFLTGHKCRVYPAPFDIRFPDGEEGDDKIRTVVQPDISVICNPAKLDEKGCRGAPDLILEILSPSSASYDRTYKLDLYERHQVREYWIVDPEGLSVEVRRLGGDGTYGAPVIRSGSGWGVMPVDAVPGLNVDLDRAFKAAGLA